MTSTAKCLAAYRGKPAFVTVPGEKPEIVLSGGERLRVREKDIEVLHPGPCFSGAGPDQAVFGEVLSSPGGDIRSAWELLQGETADIRGLAELAFGEWSPRSAWAAYALVQDGLYFEGNSGAIRARDAVLVDSSEKKRAGKEREAQERDGFLARLRTGTLNFPEDGHFLQDVEALALGTSGKSRTLKDLGRPEKPEEAHQVLLTAGFWDEWVNPWPSRCGCAAVSAREPVAEPPAEERRDLSGLRAYAIDSEYSSDPDDAVSIAVEDGRTVICAHIADPAASVLPGSAADIEARGRGATLYLPEGASRMLEEGALGRYALGLREISPALTFRLVLDGAGNIAETEIFPSLVRVTRLSYAEAEGLLSGGAQADLAALAAWAERNIRRRVDAGAVIIELPEVHIVADREGRRLEIAETVPGPAAALVRECMLLAGEGAALWASRRQLAFPFISQETGDLPKTVLPGLAGFYQLRRCMRPRMLSIKPGLHQGLGLEQYAQVTSPLRRYTDLLAHQQIRAFLQKDSGADTGPYAGRGPLSPAEMTLALGAGEAAYQATVQAERASRAHWTALYLAMRKDAVWDGVVLEKTGNRATVMIPALALETQVSLKGSAGPNDTVKLACVSARIPVPAPVFQAL